VSFFLGEQISPIPSFFSWGADLPNPLSFRLISAVVFFRLLCAIGDAQKLSAPPIKIAQKIMELIFFCAILPFANFKNLTPSEIGGFPRDKSVRQGE